MVILELLIIGDVVCVLGIGLCLFVLHHRWIKNEREETLIIRKKNLIELRNEKSRYHIATHDMLNDAKALQLACQELATAFDAETDELIFGGNWRAIRENLRSMAKEHKTPLAVSIPIEEQA